MGRQGEGCGLREQTQHPRPGSLSPALGRTAPVSRQGPPQGPAPGTQRLRMNPDDANGKTGHSPNFSLPGALSMCMWSGERVGAVPSVAAWRGVAPLTAAPRCPFLGPTDPQRAGGMKCPFSFTDRLFCAACLRVTRYLRPQLGLLHHGDPCPYPRSNQPGTTPRASRGLPLMLRTLSPALTQST